ncbi:MAG: bifunctional nuclease family protein [Spirochaetaceae bacterium]|nr:bifunctional nuclease family protein [Spirochaetaceae bacterium]
MSSETFVEADIWTVAQTDQGNVVLVRPKGSDLAVPIFIGQLETQSILIGMGGVDVPRPLTHDLAVSLIRSLGAAILRIEINDLQEGTFFARLVLVREGQEQVVDARPSDAIGIAVRAGCPVFIAESVVDEAGISVNLVTEGQTKMTAAAGDGDGEAEEAEEAEAFGESPDPGPGGAASSGEGAATVSAAGPPELQRWRRELEEAIEREDYERAALIRDRLKELGG